jgi:osmoprotectant transport system ATP-binding protein
VASSVVLENVSKTYRDHVALAPVTLAFSAGGTTVLIGESGCGKSTLLKLIVGLITPDSGRVLINGEILTSENANRIRHEMGYVIQDGGLFPHLTAEQNAALLASHLKRSEHWIGSRITELCELVRIPQSALSRHPQSLSGGQRQRISLMRSLMLDPPLLLLDEPLGALDPITRYELQGELKEIFAELHKTVILVTHDMAEAAHFGERIVLLKNGKIIQQGRIEDLLNRPAEPYVSAFLKSQRPIAAISEGRQ